MKYIFDLDGTITLKETLPLIASKFGKENCIEELTARTIKGDIPFVESFIKRVDILGKIPEVAISDFLESVPLNKELLEFIKNNSEDCIVLTGNYSGWIAKLSQKIPCRVISSSGYTDENGIVKLTKIIRKEDVVKEIKATGESVVFIGDGNNDAEAMRVSDISLACGIVHYPARSVMAIADFLVIDSGALVRLLNQIKSDQDGVSVVISSAGTGSRLGLGQTKALIKLHDRSLIQYQLSYFKNIEDVRVVVGYQADELIEHVRLERPDVIFVFNHDYFHTKTGASLYLGSRYAKKYVIAWDGDLIVHPDDINSCLMPSEYLGCSKSSSKDAVFVEVNEDGNVTRFTTDFGDYEWTGPACLERDKINFVSGHVYSMMENYLPIKVKIINAFDIDTSEDYEKAKMTMATWNLGNQCIDDYYNAMAKNIKKPTETRNKSKDFTSYDVELMLSYASPEKTVLDLGAGTGLLVNRVYPYFKKITAVEKYEGFANFIAKNANLEVVVADLLSYVPIEQYDLVSIFGVMNFFNDQEALQIYKMANMAVKSEGFIIVKNQMGVVDDVVVNGYSEELGSNYYSQYRTMQNETKLLNLAGFDVVNFVDVYPPDFNRWSNTHFYALIAKKKQQ